MRYTQRSITDPIRIEGPFRKGPGWRCRVVLPVGRVFCPTAKTRERAYKLAEQYVAGAARQGRHSVRQAIHAYLSYQQEKGNRPTSVTTSGHVLRRFFEPILDVELATLTPQKGLDLYEQLRKQKGAKTGKVLATDSHRNYLLNARSFCSWCVEKSWLSRNPLAGVKGIGKRNHGKEQLRVDERRKLWGLCVQEGGAGDDGAVGVLLALWGMRASEITTRVVRDVDDGGRQLIVGPNEALGWKPKSRASYRSVPLPQDLQRLVVARCRDKLPGSFLFQAEGGGPHWRDWVRENTKRLCLQAGVPVVCAHSLRGSYATSGVEAGVSTEQIARHMGHEKVSMTELAYITPAALAEAKQAQTRRVLTGG